MPTQALFFLNDPFVHERAAKFAADVVAATGDDAARVDFAYRRLFGRLPREDERSDALEFLNTYPAAPSGKTGSDGAATNREAWAALSRVLFSSNELLYVD